VPPIVLVDLAREPGADATTRFVQVFVDLWPVRKLRIHTAIRSRDTPAAMDAVLFLCSAAPMAGAQALADHAELIRGTLSTLESPPWEDAHRLLAPLDDLGDRTVQTLSGAIAAVPPCNETEQ
jgi:hypothetical protein